MLRSINSSPGSMTKDEDLKKVELKVSVNCCDGCKKRVLKALSIKGVLNTEIHPTLPKITVVGNVGAQTLIKKLAKCGKTAEVLPEENRKQETIEKSGKEKPKEGTSEKKSVTEHKKSNSSNSDRIKQAYGNGNKVSGKSEKETKLTEGSSKMDGESHGITSASTAAETTTTLPHMNYFVNPGMVQAPQTRAYYTVAPNYMVPMTFYMSSSCPGSNVVSPYPAPNVASFYPAPPPCCMREHCCHDSSVNQRSPMQSIPPAGFTEYFNDDNTVGCHVM